MGGHARGGVGRDTKHRYCDACGHTKGRCICPPPESGLPDAELAALAKGLLILDSAREYGLIRGGPNVDRDRCEATLERLAGQGVVPGREEAVRTAAQFVAQYNAEGR